MLRSGYDPKFADNGSTRSRLRRVWVSRMPCRELRAAGYVSAWLKCYYPAVFLAALLNSQPMGFYAPAQLVRDAQEHGVEVRPVDVNHSDWDCTLEGKPGSEGSLHPRHASMRADILRRMHFASACARPTAFQKSGTRKIASSRGRGSIPSAIYGCAPGCRGKHWGSLRRRCV